MLVVSQMRNESKVRSHWEPLADAAGSVTVVGRELDGEDADYDVRTPPASLPRIAGVVAMFFVVLAECRRRDYDAVASFSLFPYGCYALAAGRIFGLPTHLGIIGIDLDHHAVASYGAAVRALFRRFSVVSVPGTDHRERLVAMGVPAERVTVLTNAFDAGRFRPSVRPETPVYDFVWVGRCSREKDPLAFLRALAELRDRGVEFDAALVGSGPLADAVEREREELGLESDLALAGWVDDPIVYVAQARTYALTSRRDALPLTLLEAMATGAPPVVPDVGSLTDVVEHRETGYVVEETSPEALADALETLHRDDDLRARLSANAPRVRDTHSYGAARADWRRILSTLVATDPARRSGERARP